MSQVKKQEQWLCEWTPKAAFNSTADIKAFFHASFRGGVGVGDRILLDLWG